MILLIIQPAAEETSGISGPSRARRSPPAEGLTRPCCTNLRLYNESLYRLCSLIVNDELLTCESALAHWWWCHLCLMQHRQAGAAIDTIHLSISATKERADVCVLCRETTAPVRYESIGTVIQRTFDVDDRRPCGDTAIRLITYA